MTGHYIGVQGAGEKYKELSHCTSHNGLSQYNSCSQGNTGTAPSLCSTEAYITRNGVQEEWGGDKATHPSAQPIEPGWCSVKPCTTLTEMDVCPPSAGELQKEFLLPERMVRFIGQCNSASKEMA